MNFRGAYSLLNPSCSTYGSFSLFSSAIIRSSQSVFRIAARLNIATPML